MNEDILLDYIRSLDETYCTGHLGTALAGPRISNTYKASAEPAEAGPTIS